MLIRKVSEDAVPALVRKGIKAYTFCGVPRFAFLSALYLIEGNSVLKFGWHRDNYRPMWFNKLHGAFCFIK